MNLEIMKVGVFKGYSYVITHTDNGFSSWYCGYVEVPKNHIYFEQHYDNIDDIECHGGLTYSGYRFKDYKDKAYYIGFDTAHFNSEPANNLTFVENECLNIIDQLIKLNN